MAAKSRYKLKIHFLVNQEYKINSVKALCGARANHGINGVRTINFVTCKSCVRIFDIRKERL
jgi:hypothetical protein